MNTSKVLNNLLSNATKFSNDDSKITLAVKLSEKEEGEATGASNLAAGGLSLVPLTTGARIANAVMIEFSVRDRGAGISTEDQRLLFQAFSQVPSSLIYNVLPFLSFCLRGLFLFSF